MMTRFVLTLLIGLVVSISVLFTLSRPFNVMIRLNTGESTSKAYLLLVSIVNSSVSEW